MIARRRLPVKQNLQSFLHCRKIAENRRKTQKRCNFNLQMGCGLGSKTIWNGFRFFRVAAPSIRIVPCAALASCWPLPQQLLPVSAAGGGRRRYTLAMFSGNNIYIFAFGATAFAERSAAMKAPVGLLSGRAVCVSRWRGFAPTSSAERSKRYFHRRAAMIKVRSELQMPFSSTTPPVKRGFRKARRLF